MTWLDTRKGKTTGSSLHNTFNIWTRTTNFRIQIVYVLILLAVSTNIQITPLLGVMYAHARAMYIRPPSPSLRLVSWISRPPWGRGSEHSCLEVFHNGMLECNQIHDPTPLRICLKRQAQAPPLFVQDQQPTSMDLCLACGANSVPKDPFLACLCFAAASKCMKRLPCIMMVPMR